MAHSDKRAPRRNGLIFRKNVGVSKRRKLRYLVRRRMMRHGAERPGSDDNRSPPPIFCFSCGARKESGRSYCPSCGMRAPMKRTDSTVSARPVAGGRNAGRRGTVTPTASSPREAGRPDNPKTHRSWIMSKAARNLLASFALATSVLVGLQTLVPVVSETVIPAEATPPTSTVGTVDLGALRLYADEISRLGADVAAVAANGRRINEAWDQGNAEYQDTRDAMRALVSSVEFLSDRFADLEVPPMADPLAHRQMFFELSRFVSAARGMAAGFESTDSGEARTAELARFLAAAREFGSLLATGGENIRSGS